MGLFGGKVIQVASTVYNLAGEEKDRPIFLKNVILRNILSGTKQSLGSSITKSYLQGPGIQYRSFFRWCENNYGLIGLPEGTVSTIEPVPTDIMALNIPHDPGEVVWVQEAILDQADHSKWIDQWFIQNHPELADLDWTADIDDVTFEITIKMTVSLDEYTFTPVDFVPGDKYIYSYYIKSTENILSPIDYGTLTSLVPGDPFPSVIGYTLVSTVSVPRTETLTTTIDVLVEYSDATPDETSFSSSSTTPTVTKVTEVYEKMTYLGDDPTPGSDAKLSLKDIRTLITDKTIINVEDIDILIEDLGGGVTKTTTTTTNTDTLEDANAYQDDTQDIINISFTPLDMFIYHIGDGITVLDDLVTSIISYEKFFPMIPVRIDNKFVDDPSKPEWEDLHELVVKAYRRGTSGGKLSKLISKINESEDVEDMDYIYVIYGVSLNAIDKSSRKYIYEFFTRLMNDQTGGTTAYEDYLDAIDAYNLAYEDWLDWKGSSSPSYTTPPVIPDRPVLASNTINIKNSGLDVNFNISVKWNFMKEVLEDGIGKVGAKKQDVWLQFMSTTVLPKPIYGGPASPTLVETDEVDIIRVYWQYDVDKFKYIEVYGLKHINDIYLGKSVTITAKEALADTDESGFVIPLHYGTFHDMRLIDTTQMSTASVFLLINSYEVRKKKWYESWFFKIILVIVIAIVSVAFTGGAGFGILGSYASVGGALGFTGLTAAIVGSVANALAALVLSTLIGKITENLGAFGALIGALVMIVLTGAINSFNAGNGFNFNIADLMKADNLMKLTDAVGKGYQAFVQGNIIDMQNDFSKLQEEANAELRRVSQAYTDQFGYGGGTIDPTMFVGNNPVITESRDTFLTRTLMSGSDIAVMTHELLNNHAELTLTLPNAFT